MAYQLGIDLGTTYTAAAVCRSSDRRWVEPEVITLGSQSATVPSVVFVAADGSILVGEAAERRALTDPDRVVREFKRRIGDPTPVIVGGRPWQPQELSARLVRWVVDRVAEREGGPADRIAVTHPASWGAHKKELLSGALAGQGLTVTFLAEPQAAALSYSANERVGGGSTIAVYDFGGGTFDAAVVRKGDPAGGAAGFGLLGRPEGLDRLGGIDFDQVVFEHVLEGMPDAFAELDESDPAVLSAVARLRRDCTEAKEALSSDTEVSIPVLLPASRGSVRLHRSEFEAMIGTQVEETVSALRSAVISAGCDPAQLSAVLLVGGSSRIPLVAQLVSEQLGRPVAVDADPKNAIAKGAALAVSPKPTASWPGVAIPPVQGGPPGGGPQGGPHGGPQGGPQGGPPGHAVGGAAAGAGAGAAMGAPPARPPRPGMGAPPPGGGPGTGGPPPGNRPGASPYGPPNTPSHGMPPAGPPPRRPAHEPGAAPAAQAGPRSTRPSPEVERPDWDHEPEPEQRRKPNGMAIGAGALVAIGAVAAAIWLWPSGAGTATGGVETGNESGLSTSAPSSSDGGGSGGSSGGGGDAPTPDSDETTTTSVEPSEEAPSTETEPTVEPSEDASEDSGSGSGSSDGDSGGEPTGDAEEDAGGEGSGDTSDDDAAGVGGEALDAATSPVAGN